MVALGRLLSIHTRAPKSARTPVDQISADLDGRLQVSGQPEQSALWLAFSRADIDGIQPMPPVGVDRVDQAALALFESWIASLPPSVD